MKRSCIFSAFLVITGLFVVGCQCQPKAVVMTEPSVEPPPPSSLTAAWNEETFEVPFAPIDAATRAVEAIGARFGLPVGAGGTYQREDPGEGASAVSGDYFSAQTGAISSAGQFKVRCDWIADGRSIVSLSSDMPEPVHRAIAAEVRRALLTPATQPTTRQH